MRPFEGDNFNKLNSDNKNVINKQFNQKENILNQHKNQPIQNSINHKINKAIK
jgi:hypothetical protein